MAYQKFKDYRLGESVRQKNSMIATITDYPSAADMTVQFEDGKVVEHVKYFCFINGDVNYDKKEGAGNSSRLISGYCFPVVGHTHKGQQVSLGQALTAMRIRIEKAFEPSFEHKKIL